MGRELEVRRVEGAGVESGEGAEEETETATPGGSSWKYRREQAREREFLNRESW